MLRPEILDSLRASLFAGQYNLLLGSGASLDSLDSDRKPLLSASALTKNLCELKNVSTTTPLSRVALLLKPDEIDEYLTKPYASCRPGETVKRITTFVWRAIYSFNIDDALEAAYETSTRRRQRAIPLNYDTNYRTPANQSKVSIIHLHGFTREPEKGYVFSAAEYARVTNGMNPWMHVLSELLATEPFIVSGTSLNESDLEYYLSARSNASLRTNRGPSILVEPYPDAITESLCDRHGLILVKATLAEFLHWTTETLGHSPQVSQLKVPSMEGLLDRGYGPDAQIEFFSSFELVKPAPPNPAAETSPFFYGKAPRWSDLESSLDLPTDDERRVSAKIRNYLESQDSKTRFFMLLAESGSGKTTVLRRVAYDLAKEGRIVLNLNGKLALDPDNTRKGLAAITKPALIVIDNLADHASSILTALSGLNVKRPIAVLCADRDYRRDHIFRLLGDFAIEEFSLSPWTSLQYEDFIERFRKAGLVGTPDAIRMPRKYAGMLVGDPVAIAGCRVLNNFKPLDQIVDSLWHDANQEARSSYALAAIAEFCYSGGISYPILERAQKNSGLRDQLSLAVPLPLAYSEDGDFVLPLHPAIGERLLSFLSRDKRPLLAALFRSLALALAPYVNRQTIIDRTPEARLAGRLFNAERVVRPLLREKSHDFYQIVQAAWQWNSRYWEQRAILSQDKSIDQAIQFARHAVAIEEHPFPKTTLASLIVRKMESQSNPEETLFDETYSLLETALRDEATRGWRPTPHPYSVLFHAILVFGKSGRRLSAKRESWIRDRVEYCTRTFPRDLALIGAAMRILKLLNKK
ncbi:MAG TPA: SIR2 family protein [Variovorax sp.]|nr:SIR2 family protein [Variovorax sp.]